MKSGHADDNLWKFLRITSLKVDYMLGTFMEEMQITPEQFEMACLEGRQNTAAGSAFSFHQGLFQQVRIY